MRKAKNKRKLFGFDKLFMKCNTIHSQLIQDHNTVAMVARQSGKSRFVTSIINVSTFMRTRYPHLKKFIKPIIKEEKGTRR